MSRYFIELSYDGTNYHGWQVQPNAVSVQATLEKALTTLLRGDVSVLGAGRTDTGVHASYFVAHFDLETKIDADNLKMAPTGPDFLYKINSFLPRDILIHSVQEVSTDLHARFSAKYREYVYHISKVKPVFRQTFSSYNYGNLDIEAMNEACKVLMEYRDFTSFSKLHTDVKTNDCKIMLAHWRATEEGYDFRIRADRFLRNMVRSIVGTMLDIGKGKMSLDEFRAVIEAKDRGKAGTSAEAKGLFLVDIGYVEGFKRTIG